MTVADRTPWPLDDDPSSGDRVRSALSDVGFLALLILLVTASWLWGPKISVVLSESMNPTYTAGDALFVVPWGTPGVGDIVQFSVPLAPGQAETTVPVTHRIIGQDERGFITKGDNPSATPDYWRVTPDMIEGQVLFWMPRTWMFRGASALIGLALLLFLWPKSEAAAPMMDPVWVPGPPMVAPVTTRRSPAFPQAGPGSFQTGRPSTVPTTLPQGRPLPLPPPYGAKWGAL